MSITGIQDQLLQVSVICCNKLKDTEWFSRQDPYVCLEYAGTKKRTRTCTDGGTKPNFHEKFAFSLIEGLREISVVVWNSNTFTRDDFIGSGKVQLHKVLSQGYDDSAWPLQDKKGRHAGEVRLIMHYSKDHKSAHFSYAPSTPLHVGAPPPYSAPPPYGSYPPTSYLAPPSPAYPSYPPNSVGYSAPPCYQQPPPVYPPTYPPPSAYPPPPSTYPPPPYPPC